nr:hypothetical protein [Tanacetum cinerariifolium]
MLDTKAYKEYYVIVSGAEPPKEKNKVQEEADEPVTSSKTKTVPASKGSRLKSSAKVATKRSKKDFHMSHVSSSGNGVDIQSKVHDEQQQKETGTNEGASVRPEDDEETDVNGDSEETESGNDGDDLTHPNLSTYKEDDEEEEKEKADDDDDEVSYDHRVYTPPDHQLTDEEENQEGDDEVKEGEEEQEEEEELYGDLNINLHRIAASLSEFKLKKILIDKMEENQSVNRSDIQKNLYNALVESYNSDKDIFSLYGDIVTLKRGRDDQDKDEDPSTRSNRVSKRRRSGKEAESSKEMTHKESKSTNSLKDASRSQPKSSGKSAHAEEHGQKVYDLEDQSHQEFNTGNNDETSDYFINNDLEYLKGGSLSKKYTTSITKTKAADYGQVKWIEGKGSKRQRLYEYASNMESLYDVYSRYRIIAVTRLKIMEWFGYSHLKEIIVRRQDDKLYNFREGYFKRLQRQDIKDRLLLLVQDKLSNLNLEEQYALNVALRMFTQRIFIQGRMEDLQLGVKSYQKKINLKRPDTYRLDLRRMTPYTAYHDIQGIIYEDEMNINRLMSFTSLAPAHSTMSILLSMILPQGLRWITFQSENRVNKTSKELVR